MDDRRQVDGREDVRQPRGVHARRDQAVQRSDAEGREAAASDERLRERYRSLTPREREVLLLIVRGLLNKQAAAMLGISIVTLQVHRSNVMRKMGAGSLAELVRWAAMLGIPADGDERSR